MGLPTADEQKKNDVLKVSPTQPSHNPTQLNPNPNSTLPTQPDPIQPQPPLRRSILDAPFPAPPVSPLPHRTLHITTSTPPELHGAAPRDGLLEGQDVLSYLL